MSMTPEQAAWFRDTFTRLVDNVDQALLGKREVVGLVLSAMLAEGHVLLEDAPGTGKTSLAKAIAASVQGTSTRIQFTPDLLPSDVTGVTIYDQQNHRFEFHGGPVFASIVLADEINRASPKTQSALLEVMEESRVTVDGVAHEVGRPFLVIATQNPIEQSGTYKLPEAQLDRFMLKTSIGYPSLAVAERIMAGAVDRNPSATLAPVITTGAVADMADLAASVHIDPAVARYAAQLVEATRASEATRLGVSVRGAISMMRVAKVYAASQGRHFVIPDDIKTLAVPVWAHRLVLDPEAEFSGTTAETVVQRALTAVEAPLARAAS
ncbi:MoxR family ATPase [Microbacterium aurum]|jgi:MoxR-like ATPase|uniref:AAA family ATPase n=1 Tax=Microbacterium aurum TaxID=36805 RepID=UPI00248D6620|nr:MoxR family ATPase [Microbacterium aurum]MBZ6372371.1 MoxR family ATPase [Microbacterium hominis]